MINDRVSFKDFIPPEDNLQVKVGKYLISKGYHLIEIGVFRGGCPMTLDDVRTSPRVNFESSAIYFSWKRPWRILLLLIPPLFRREYVGTICFTAEEGASPEHWIYEVFGRKHLNSAQQLAKEMAATFNVKIIVKLMREKPAE